MRRFYSQHLGAKAFSLFLAYLVWAWVVSRTPLVKLVTIPVDVSPQAETILLDYQPKQIAVRLEGDPGVIRRLSADDLIARVPGPRLGRDDRRAQRTVHVTPQDVRGVPGGIEVEIRDSQVQLTLEPATTRPARVQVRRVGEPPPGYRLRLTPDPAVVNVTGPASEVRKINFVATSEVDVSGQTRSYEVRADLALPEPHVRVEPDAVRVAVSIEPLPPPETPPPGTPQEPVGR